MKLLYTFWLLVLTSMAFANEGVERRRTVEQDGIRLTVGGKDGYKIDVDGFSFSHLSTLFVIDPSWTERYYGYNDQPLRVEESTTAGVTTGAVGLTYELRSDRSESVTGEQTLEILPGRKLRVATDIRMTTDVAGVIENRLAAISEAWLSNTTWTARLADGSTTEGRTPRWAPGTVPSETTLLADFRSVTFHSPQGPLTIETTGPVSMALLDYRRNQWAEGKKYYWLGILGSPLGEDPMRYEVVFSFPERAMRRPSRTAVADLRVTTKVVTVAPPVVDRIVPSPKEITWHEDSLPVPGLLSFSVVGERLSKEAGARYEDILLGYNERLGRLHNVVFAAGDGDSATVRVMVDERSDGDDPDGPLKREGYRIDVTTDGVEIGDVRTTVGLLNALRTFEQLLRHDGDGNAMVRRAEIRDWPALPFRGIHFFTGKDARDLQLKMVDEILAPLKINNLVYQVDYVKWESQPQIHSERYGMEKGDAVAVADRAREQGIDVIPLVNTFGHSEWLLQKPEMRYLADDPGDPYAYDPSNPEVYRICEEIYREAIRMFNPSVIHIGHDEVHLDGFPKKPENKAVGATQLFIDDTRHYHRFLEGLGIRTMMWGDMLIGPGEAPDAALAPTVEEGRRRRENLPKDIVIADWHYMAAPVERYGSPAIFNKDGFSVVGCTWNAPDNIVRFAKAMSNHQAQTSRSMGLMQTTWAGYSFDEGSLARNLEQYIAYVLAAEAAWTGGYEDSSEVPFDYGAVFFRRWDTGRTGGSQQVGWTADLRAAAKYSLGKIGEDLTDGAFAGWKGGMADLGEYRFNIADRQGEAAVVVLPGALAENPDEAQALQLNSRKPLDANQLVFAMATPYWVPDGTRVGTLRITQESGAVQEVALTYGVNVKSLADNRQTLASPVIWRTEKEPAQGGAAIHGLRWENPEPANRITCLELRAAKSGPGLIVFGVSGY